MHPLEEEFLEFLKAMDWEFPDVLARILRIHAEKGGQVILDTGNEKVFCRYNGELWAYQDHNLTAVNLTGA